MLNTLKGLEENTIVPEKQDDALSNYAPIISREMGFLKFDKPAREISNLIRGFNPWPAAYFMLEGKRIKVFAATVGDKTDKEPATIIKADDELVISCAQGTTLALTEIQPEGSKRMNAKDYLIGHKIGVGTKVGE
jgi:methionyl-tRNA formyltransferase